MKDRVCVVIQARLGSQRIPQKMIKPFSGTTLLDIALKTIKSCESFSQNDFWLSVCESELVKIGKNHGVNIFHRSLESANSEGTPMSLMYEWHDKLKYDYVVLINACSPLLSSRTIDGFVESFKNSNSEGMFGVIKKRNYFWNCDGNIITPLTEDVMNTKTVPPVFEAAHCLYASRLDTIKDGVWMGNFNKAGEVELYEIPEEESFDIDHLWQFEIGEEIYRSKVK